jgi:2-polyprenyl-6-methoxyphenol hydroxylase-like FAD-dependent oxidoreductase
LLSHRVSLHDALKAAATGDGEGGRPCILKTSSRVSVVDPHAATVTLDDGSVFSGDLVLGADGVGVCPHIAIEL